MITTILFVIGTIIILNFVTNIIDSVLYNK